MADPRYGAGGGGFDDTLARMNQQAAAADELARKEQARAGVEERTTGRSTGAIADNVGVRDRLVGSTERLSAALKGSLDALDAETRALERNTAAWSRRGAAAGGVATPRAASGGASAAPAFIGPVESPQLAQARASDAAQREAQATLQAQAARSAVTSATRTAGTTPEQLAPLIAQREAANQALVSARAQSKAAQDNVTAQERAAAAQNAATSAAAAENARLATAYAAHAAAEEEAAVAARENAVIAAASARRQASAELRSVTAGAGQLAGPEQRLITAGPGLSGGPSSLISDAPQARNFIAGPVGGTGRVTPGIQSGGAIIPPKDGGFNDIERAANANAIALDRTAGAQQRVNQAVQQSVAQYGASSQALQRHGALTSEFIQAFSRGEVTLKEFQSQMLTTIGKFGGWAVAGAFVYGAVDALKKLADGAKEAQSGYTQLTRFIPGVQQAPAQRTFTDISSQLNVPIKDVVDTMTIMARTFKTLPEAALATRAALLASRLDQIAPTASAPYLVGIKQAFNLDGAGTLKVVDSLNALQREYGARVAETLPGLAKAAPAALAAGVDQHTLEALIGVGVRAGFSGSQVATAVARSATTFVQKPQDQALLESHGFNPNQPYADLIRQISSTIAERDKAGNPISGKELRDLAIGLAGPQLGSRTFAGILARGGLINQFAQTAANPGETATQERQKQLGSISEQFSSIGIGIENFGASLSSTGILLPLQALLTVLHQVGQAANTLVSPLAAIGTALGGLPGPLKEIIGALALGAGAQRVYRSTFGNTAAGAVGQIPGFSFLDTPNAQAVRGLTNTQSTGLEFARNRQERLSGAAANAAQDYNAAYQSRAAFQVPEDQRPNIEQFPAERRAYEDELSRKIADESKAESKVIATQEAYLTALDATRQFEAQIAVLKGKELSNAEKVAYAASAGLATTPFGAPTTLPVQTAARARLDELQRNAELTPEARAQTIIAGARGGGGSIGGSLGSISDETIANQSLIAAENQQPGFIAGRFQRLQGKLGTNGSVAGALGAAALGGAAGSRPIGAVDRAVTGAGGIGSALTAGIPGALGAAFTGILAGQLAQAVLPGAVGNAAGSTITGGALGLGGASLLSSVLGRYGVAGISPVAGFAVGAGLSAAGSSNPIASLLGGGVAGGAGGSILTKILAGFAPEGAAAPELAIPLALAGVAVAGLNHFGDTSQKLTAAQIRQGAPAPPPSFLGFDGASGLGSLFVQGFTDPFGNDAAAQKKKYDARLASFNAQQAQIASASQVNFGSDTVRNFGDVFAQQLTDAFTKTGQDAKTALTTIQHRITILASNVSTFGPESRSGQNSSKLLAEAAGQGVLQAGRDPNNVDQYIQITEKADQALEASRQQTYQLAGARAKSGQDRAAALQALIDAENKAIAVEYTNRIPDLTTSLTTLSTRYNELLAQRAAEAPGSKARATTTARLNAVGTEIGSTRGSITALQDRANQLRAQNLLKNAPEQLNVYSSVDSDIQARGTLEQAKAGTDKLAQLRAQLKTGQEQIANAGKNLTLNPQTRTNDLETLRAKLIGVNQAITQEVLARTDSLQKLQEAMVPLNTPDAAINKVLSDAQANLRTMLAHPQAFTAEQVNQQRLAIAQDQRTKAQEGLTNVNAQGALSQSSIPSYDPVALASGALDNATQAAAYIQAHAKDFKYSDILNALAQVNSARQAVADAIHQNQSALVTAQGAIAKEGDYGNVVAQAQDDINTAARQLALARTPLERAQAYGALLTAQNAYNSALETHIKNQTDFAASLTNDPVEKARIQLQGAQRELATAKGPDNKLTAAANVNNLKQAYEQSLVQQRQSTVDFQLNMQQITVQQAINQLQDLLKVKDLTLATRQGLLSRIRQLQNTDNTGGQFDLAPGNIKLPTPYDVKRAVQNVIGARVRAQQEAVAEGGTAGATGHTGTSNRPAGRGGYHDISSVIGTGRGSIGQLDARTYFTINVGKDADINKVADAIERSTGTRIAARARAARR